MVTSTSLWVAFQITSTSNSEKIKKTLRKFVEYKLYEKYDSLIIYILTEKQQSYSGKGYEELIQNKFAFDKDKTTDKIEDNLEQLIAFSWIALSQFEQGKQKQVLETLTVALQIQDHIKEDKQKLIKALKTIAGMQAMAGKGEDAVKTAEKILTERNLYLPGIASWLVKTGDKENFKRLLIPCAYNVEIAYQMCGLIARLYPEQAELVAKAVTDLN